jgi:hypothetical protein
LKVVARLATLALPLAVAACASAGGLRQEPLNAGVQRSFAAPLLRTVNAARTAMAGAGITIEEATQVAPNAWMIMGKKGVSGFSWGELVRVVVEESPPGQCAVRVISKRKVATNITAAGDWSRSLLDQIALSLAN